MRLSGPLVLGEIFPFSPYDQQMQLPKSLSSQAQTLVWQV
jgi:hypothetical protein